METTVSLVQMLDARERRVQHQQELLAQYHKPLICFTMNICGPIKDSPLIRRGFARGRQLLRQQFLRREITDDDKSNIDHIYTMIAGSAGGGSYSGEYLRGDGSSIELDISAFTDPTTKNAADLVTYAIHAWESGWGYVWGTYGSVLTDSLFAYKLEQYPDGVGSYADFIRANWLGGRTTDCVGLIKGYGWLNPDTITIEYGTNGMPDLGANQMYYNASVSGTIDTMPDIPGLAVWHDGHIGVYIGDGYVIEAMNTKKGVVKTKLEGRGWTHWLQIEYINYD